MTTNKLLCFPVELLTRIFQGCDSFSDLVALASSCKILNAVWSSQAPDLIWKLASTRIMAFDSALMAVRATAIVVNSRNDGVEPPHPFPIRQLSGRENKPLPGEMKAVFDFEHLVKCVEWMMFHWKMDHQPEDEYGELLLKLKAPGQWTNKTTYETWKERLYRGLYHILLAGAVCSRPYNAPFVLAEKEGRTGFLERCSRCALFARGPLILTPEDFDYLRTFPVYNFNVPHDSEVGRWRDKEFETIFGPLSEWLIEDGAKRGLEENLKPVMIPDVNDAGGWDFDNAGSFDGCQVGLIREIKSLIGAYEHFSRKFSRRDYSIPGLSTKSEPILDFPEQKRVTAVVFGHFHLDEISMPKRIEESENMFLIARPTLGTPGARTINIRAVQHQLHRTGPEFEDDYRPTPPEFQLFSFLLRRYLNLKLEARNFHESFHMIYMVQLIGGELSQVPYIALPSYELLVMYRAPVFS